MKGVEEEEEEEDGNDVDGSFNSLVEHGDSK